MIPHLQHISPSGDRTATLDAAQAAIVVADEAGTVVRRLPIPNVVGARGFRWLASEAGFAVWTDDRVYTVDIDDRHAPLIAFRIEQPDGYPYSLHGVRSLPAGLLVTAESCARDRGLVGLHAHVVHLDGSTPFSQTPLEPWAGAVLYDAFAMTDGRIVLSISEQEYFDAMRLRCFADVAKQHGYVDKGNVDRDLICRVSINQHALGASTFRVVEVEQPARVRIVGEHACPDDRGCVPQNWAPSSDELIWGAGQSARRLVSPIETDPLFPTSGVWSTEVPLNPEAWRSQVGSLWLRDEHLLAADRDRVSWVSLDEGERWHWSHPRDSVQSARLTPDGASAIVATERRVLQFNLATGRHKRLLRRGQFDPQFSDSMSESFFSDASLSPDGVLLVDVAATAQLRSISQIGTAPGYGHQGCKRLPRRPDESGIDFVPRARALAPWFRKRTDHPLWW